jgi:hypothetical protein
MVAQYESDPDPDAAWKHLNAVQPLGRIGHVSSQVVGLEAAITFDSNGVMTADITHVSGAAGITLVNAGTYETVFSA